MLKLVHPSKTPELHFYNPDRSAFGAGFSYGLPRPRGLKRQMGRDFGRRRGLRPILAHRILQELRWGRMTGDGVPGRNGHPGPCNFGFMQHLGVLAKFGDRSLSRAGSTEKL